jgi:toxin HigB-1
MIVSRYYRFVIISFACADTQKVFEGEYVKSWGRDVQNVARRKLAYLNQAVTLIDLRTPPGNRLEKLKGDRPGRFSIRVNDQYRLCFRWHDGNASEVELVDYH